VATIEYGDVSNRGSSDARDRACRLFVQNLSWGSGEAELTAHLDTVIPGGVVSVSVLRHADGRSRGIAKVVVQAPIDTQTVIEELNGKELDGRALEIARDRL
jgi:RNA recognition motif-containing protein